MKKALLLLAASVALTFSAVCVSAEDYTPDTQGKYNIEYSVGEENAAGMYGMVAIKGTNTIIDTSNLENIHYIDQASADADGVIFFTDFAPKGVAPDSADFAECTVFIGGPGFDTAEAIGVLKKATTDGPVDPDEPDVPVDPTYAITGKVISTTGTTAATITVKDASGATVATTQADVADGTFSVTVPAGTYSVEVAKKGHCSYTVTGVPATAAVALGDADISTLAGDINTSDDVNFYDLNEILNNYLKKDTDADFNAEADINDSGDINFYDLNVVLGNYLNKAITKAYSAE